VDVVTNPEAMAEMLKASQGIRQVPVLVEEGQVKIGFGGA
jgi:glutaredoxin